MLGLVVLVTLVGIARGSSPTTPEKAAKSFSVVDVLLLDTPLNWHALTRESAPTDWLAAFDNLRTWLEKQGGMLYKATPWMFENVYHVNTRIGVKAVSEINPGDAILRIPEKLLFSSSNALSRVPSDIRELLDKANLSEEDILRVLLMYERSRGKDSPWFSWIGLLNPSDPPSTKFPKDHTTLQISASRMKKSMSQWKKTVRLLQSMGMPRWFENEVLQRWAWSTYEDLSWTITRPKGASPPSYPALIPLFDCFESMRGQTTWAYFPASRAVILYALRTIRPGDQIFLDTLPESRDGLLSRFRQPHPSWTAKLEAWLPSGIAPPPPDAPASGSSSWLFYHIEVDPPSRTAYRHRVFANRPPTELLNALRVNWHPQVRKGELSAIEAEYEVLLQGERVLNMSIDAVGGLKYTAQTGSNPLISSLHWLSTQRRPNQERMSMWAHVLHHLILHRNAVLVRVLRQLTADRLSSGRLLTATHREIPFLTFSQQHSEIYALSILHETLHLSSYVTGPCGLPSLSFNGSYPLSSLLQNAVLELRNVDSMSAIVNGAQPPNGEGECRKAVQIFEAIIASDAHTLLCDAVREGDHSTAEQILQLGVAQPNSLVPLHSLREAGYHLLHLAAKALDVQMMQILLMHGADPNVQTFTGDTPLHLVVRGITQPMLPRVVAAVGLLLGASADVNLKNMEGVSPAKECSRDVKSCYGLIEVTDSVSELLDVRKQGLGGGEVMMESRERRRRFTALPYGVRTGNKS